MSFKNSVAKGEITHNEQFLCFLPFWRTFHHFPEIENCCLQPLSVWKSLKFFIWEKVKHSFTQINIEASTVKFGEFFPTQQIMGLP